MERFYIIKHDYLMSKSYFRSVIIDGPLTREDAYAKVMNFIKLKSKDESYSVIEQEDQ